MFAKKIYAPLAKALDENSVIEPRGFQKQAFSYIKAGTDIICEAEEGGGKTTMLVIGVIQKLQKALNDVPRALVFTPEPETAEQVKAVFDLLAVHTDLRIFNVHGTGTGNNSQDDMKTQVYMGSDVIIGTPKRIGELYSENVLNLSDLRLFVIDDAELHTRQDANSQLERLSDSAMKAQFLILTTNLNERISRYADRFLRSDIVVQ